MKENNDSIISIHKRFEFKCKKVLELKGQNNYDG